MGTPRISYERAKEAVDAASWAILQGLGARQGACRLGITENALQEGMCMSFEADVNLVYQTVLAEAHGNERMALWDLSHRFVLISRGYSPGYARTAAIEPAPVKVDVPPSDATSDDWLVTAKA